MKLNHLNLVVSNVAEAIVLFETYFNFKCTDIKGDNVVAILKGADDFTLVVMTQKESKAIYPDVFHVGFMLDSTSAVLETYDKIKKWRNGCWTRAKENKRQFWLLFYL